MYRQCATMFFVGACLLGWQFSMCGSERIPSVVVEQKNQLDSVDSAAVMPSLRGSWLHWAYDRTMEYLPSFIPQSLLPASIQAADYLVAVRQDRSRALEHGTRLLVFGATACALATLSAHPSASLLGGGQMARVSLAALSVIGSLNVAALRRGRGEDSRQAASRAIEQKVIRPIVRECKYIVSEFEEKLPIRIQAEMQSAISQMSACMPLYGSIRPKMSVMTEEFVQMAQGAPEMQQRHGLLLVLYCMLQHAVFLVQNKSVLKNDVVAVLLLNAISNMSQKVLKSHRQLPVEGPLRAQLSDVLGAPIVSAGELYMANVIRGVRGQVLNCIRTQLPYDDVMQWLLDSIGQLERFCPDLKTVGMEIYHMYDGLKTAEDRFELFARIIFFCVMEHMLIRIKEVLPDAIRDSWFAKEHLRLVADVNRGVLRSHGSLRYEREVLDADMRFKIQKFLRECADGLSEEMLHQLAEALTRYGLDGDNLVAQLEDLLFDEVKPMLQSLCA